ncbi:MAG: putative nitrogen fixation protein NifT [Pseudomonadota bacterium]
MKVMIRDTAKGMEVYVPKKDLEEIIAASEFPDYWGGWVRLTNGWVLELPEMAEPPKLPITVDARRLAHAE